MHIIKLRLVCRNGWSTSLQWN